MITISLSEDPTEAARQISEVLPHEVLTVFLDELLSIVIDDDLKELASECKCKVNK